MRLPLTELSEACAPTRARGARSGRSRPAPRDAGEVRVKLATRDRFAPRLGALCLLRCVAAAVRLLVYDRWMFHHSPRQPAAPRSPSQATTRQAAALKVPEGLSPPDTRNAVKIPPLDEPETRARQERALPGPAAELCDRQLDPAPARTGRLGAAPAPAPVPVPRSSPPQHGTAVPAVAASPACLRRSHGVCVWC